MAIEPWFVGQTGPALTIYWKKSDNSILDITGGTQTGTITKLGGSITASLAGSFSVSSGTDGIGTYAWHANDVASAGTFVLRFSVVIGGLIYRQKMLWTIEEWPSAA
jgi:hypothetical protein